VGSGGLRAASSGLAHCWKTARKSCVGFEIARSVGPLGRAVRSDRAGLLHSSVSNPYLISNSISGFVWFAWIEKRYRPTM
jgi:hypothetical protein